MTTNVPKGWTPEQWGAARLRSIESARTNEALRRENIAKSAAEDAERQGEFDRLSRRQQDRILNPDSADRARSGSGDGDI